MNVGRRDGLLSDGGGTTGDERRVMRVGHRGAAGYVLENTLRSIEHAIGLGVDAVEVDVQLTRDGGLVIMHDPTVDRTTTSRGRVADLTLAEIRGLRTVDGQRVPTLEEVLTVCDGRVGVVLEVKAVGIGDRVLQRVEARGFTGPVIYASFHHDDIQSIKARSPAAVIMPLIGRGRIASARIIALQAEFVGIRFDRMTTRVVGRFRAAGVRTAAYTVNRPEEIRAMKRMGVDVLISDYPDLLD